MSDTIIFDGVCVLCNSTVNWIERHSAPNRFRFVPFQSQEGQQLLSDKQLNTTTFDSVVLIVKQKAYTGSDAFFQLLTRLCSFSWLGKIGLAIPRAFREWVYTTFAKNRVAWFGEKNYCRLPG